MWRMTLLCLLIEAGSEEIVTIYECPFVCFSFSLSFTHSFISYTHMILLLFIPPSQTHTHTNIIQYFIMTWISYRQHQPLPFFCSSVKLWFSWYFHLENFSLLFLAYIYCSHPSWIFFSFPNLHEKKNSLKNLT